MDGPLVVVAMSGGVDSSVAAALLVAQGYRVAGMMLRLWSEEGREYENRCCTPDSMAQARRVAAMLDIPFYAVDVRERFRGSVVREFLEGYQRGLTPNPCIVCNRFIRWGTLLEQAMAVGAEYMATGHYARLIRPEGRPVELWRAQDERKDQSYVLSSLNQNQLARTLLPLGEYSKPEVRELARKYQLPVAERPDSQDLCFLGNEDYRTFVARHAPETVHPGLIVNREGVTLGEHQGLAFYTIGQRKGLGIRTGTGKSAAPEPYYVLEKDMASNRLVVGMAAELGKQSMSVREVNWIAGEAACEVFDAQIKIRYKAAPAGAVVTPLADDRLHVEFNEPMRDITPGQQAVFYQGERVLASGLIEL